MSSLQHQHHQEQEVEHDVDEDQSVNSSSDDDDNDDDDDDVHLPPETPLPARMSHDDSRRMKLTREEHRWALDIKDCISMIQADLDYAVSDFMCAQLALICQDNVKDAIRRVYGLQAFRREYKIRDDFQDGKLRLQRHVARFPRQWLSLNFSPNDGTYVFIHDMAQAERPPHVALEDWFASAYYIHTLLCPDLETIRKGTIVCVECQDLGWQKGTKIMGELVMRMFAEFLAYYPCKVQTRNYHTSVMFNCFVSSCRKALPAQLKDSFQAGCQFDGHLGQALLTPTVEIANQRLLYSLEQVLKRRYRNEAEFRLEEDCW